MLVLLATPGARCRSRRTKSEDAERKREGGRRNQSITAINHGDVLCAMMGGGKCEHWFGDYTVPLLELCRRRHLHSQKQAYRGLTGGGFASHPSPPHPPITTRFPVIGPQAVKRPPRSEWRGRARARPSRVDVRSRASPWRRGRGRRRASRWRAGARAGRCLRAERGRGGKPELVDPDVACADNAFRLEEVDEVPSESLGVGAESRSRGRRRACSDRRASWPRCSCPRPCPRPCPCPPARSERETSRSAREPLLNDLALLLRALVLEQGQLARPV